MIGNYSSVSRSLRWIIEAAVFWTDMQSDYQTSTRIYEYFITVHAPINSAEYSYLYRHTSESNRDLLEERLSLKAKWKKYGIGDMLDNVILNTDGVYNKPKGHSLKSEIQQAYKELSGFDHISIDSLQEIDKMLRTDYAIYMDHSYDPKRYSYQLMNLWNVVDLVTTIVVLAGTKYYEYPTTHDYLDNIQKYYKKESATKELIHFIQTKRIQDKLRLFSLTI